MAIKPIHTLTGIAFLAAVLFSCTSLQEDLVVSENQEYSEEQLLKWEEILLREEIDGFSAQALDDLEKEMEAQGENSLNRQYQAALYAFRSWTAFLKEENRVAGNYMEKALEQDSRENWVLYIQAREMPPEEALDFIKEENRENLPRLTLLQASILYNQGKYGESLVLFDQSLPLLPPIYAELYQEKRDRSWEMKDNDSSSNVTEMLSDEPINFRIMLDVTLKETLLLDFFSRENQMETDELFDLLQEEEFILAGKSQQRKVKRGDAALFLWHLIIRKENKPEMVNMYDGYFDETPIPDLSLDSPYFNSVLGCVEREIMELPDGQNFEQEGPVSGWDFLKMLMLVEEY